MDKFYVYVGTYADPSSQGIYIYELDLASGALTPVGGISNISNPSFLAIHPNRRFLYAVNEVESFGGERSGAVSAFSIQPETGQLTFLNQQSSHGTGPCHLIVDSQGKNVLVANYGSGSVAVLPVAADGRLQPATSWKQHVGSSVDKSRQEGPHAHSINLDAANHFALAADLGLDKILVYRYDADQGTLTPDTPPFGTVPPGSGPRHLAFHPNGHYAYVVNEMHCTVTALHYDAQHGTLKEFQTLSTLPAGTAIGNSSGAEIQVHPSGKFLYSSNRGQNSIALFAIDQQTGKLHYEGEASTEGKTPRNFSLDPTGTYLLAANQDSDSIVVFRVDSHTGHLKPTGQVIQVPKPVCIKMLPIAR
jgi:6-phosphogluconolactonase